VCEKLVLPAVKLMEMRATNRRMVSLVAMVLIVAGALEVFR